MSTAPAPAPGPDPKHLAILEAARRVWARRGLDATRMDEIAAEARVSKGTLYNYFESKEALIVASLLAHYRAGEERLGELATGRGRPAEELARGVRVLLDLYPELIAEMRVSFQAWAVVARHEESQASLFRALTALYREREDDWVRLVRRGQAAGEFRRDAEPGAFARGLLALYDGFLYRSAFDPESADVEALRACIAQWVDTSLAPRRSRARGEGA